LVSSEEDGATYSGESKNLPWKLRQIILREVEFGECGQRRKVPRQFLEKEIRVLGALSSRWVPKTYGNAVASEDELRQSGALADGLRKGREEVVLEIQHL
jgi:hypothetical protein